MWVKIVLLLIYFIVLFVLARVLETVTWCGTGNLSRRLLDPMAMSVLKLKALLEQRGISYEGAVEKQELSELVSSTGAVTDAELAESTLEETSEMTNFTSGSHFYEQVEDAKDSVWLVQVLFGRSHMADKSWIAIRKKISKFGVHVGMFDCNLDMEFCRKKQWSSTQLILGVPQDFETKARVSLYTYTGSYKVHNVYNWVKTTVNTKVHPIQEYRTFKSDWLTFSEANNREDEIRVVLFTKYPSVPLFFSALSVKFPGRVKFGMVDISTRTGKHIMKRTNYQSAPLYLVITSEDMYNFGSKPGDYITFRSMETFLKILYPSVNDLFVSSLVICNVLSWFEVCLIQGSIMRRFVKFIWCVVKFNMILFLFWIAILALFQLPLMNSFTKYGLKIFRLFGTSTIARLFRQDLYYFVSNMSFLELSFIAYILVVALINFKLKEGQVEDTNPETNEWNFAQFQTLAHVFYPSYALPSYLRRSQMDIEGHLGVMPGITNGTWISAASSKEYIKHLPTWKYHYVVTQDVEVPRNVSENEKGQDQITTSCDHLPAESLVQNDHVTSNQRVAADSLVQDEHVTNSNESDSDHGRNSSSEPEIHTQSKMQEKDNLEHNGAPEGYLHCNQCVICLDNYSNGVVICGLPCGHCFHKTCIVLWLVRDNHYCPVCRWPSNRSKSEIHLHSE